MKWIEEWPTKQGTYWFYGWRFAPSKCHAAKDPELFHVEVWANSNSISYIARGGFMYKTEGAYGKWKPVDKFKLPGVIYPEDK